MAVVAAQNYLRLKEKLTGELNSLAKRFNASNYSKIENIENLLLKRDISVEKKKAMLMKKLHEEIARAFSIKKEKFSKKSFGALKRRLHNIRKLMLKLRSINYYLETMFLDDLKLSKIKLRDNLKLKSKSAVARDELEALEYTAFKLIEEVVMLDKRLVKEYKKKEKRALRNEKLETKDIEWVLKKESELMEHLEAKLPPPKATHISLVKEPIFTHWAARVFALLLSLEHFFEKEALIFRELKKNKSARAKISRKIIQLIREKSQLLKVMEEKTISMKKFGLDEKLKKDLHNITTIISI